jgi:hypothetical protein
LLIFFTLITCAIYAIRAQKLPNFATEKSSLKATK